VNISEVRVRLIPNRSSSDRLRAFCSITLDGSFVIRDLKIIDGANGVFVAMPSRKLADRCPRCRAKNHLRANFCNECGVKLKRNRVRRDNDGRPKLHADVAHPINTECREQIEKAVREAYALELERSKAPDYQPAAYDDDEFSDSDYDDLISDLKRDAARRRSERDSASGTFPSSEEDAEVSAGFDEPVETQEPATFERAERPPERRPQRDDRRDRPRREERRFEPDRKPEPPPPKPVEKIAEPRPAPAVEKKPEPQPAPEPDSEFGAGIF